MRNHTRKRKRQNSSTYQEGKVQHTVCCSSSATEILNLEKKSEKNWARATKRHEKMRTKQKKKREREKTQKKKNARKTYKKTKRERNEAAATCFLSRLRVSNFVATMLVVICFCQTFQVTLVVDCKASATLLCQKECQNKCQKERWKERHRSCQIERYICQV